MIKHFALSALSASLLLSGCSSLGGSLKNFNGTFEDFGTQARMADTASEAAKLGAPSRWAFGNQLDGAVIDSWREIISDPQLLDLITEALNNNLSLQASVNNIARSQAILGQSREAREPSFGYNLSPALSSPLENISISDRYSGGLNASWEMDLWGAIDADIARAEFDLEGARAFYEVARQALIANVARAFISAIEDKRQLELTQATLGAQLETLRIVNAQYEFGATAKSSQVLAQSDVASARDTLLVAEASLRASIRALQVLLGRYPDGSLSVPSNFPNIQTSIIAGAPADLLRRRPDILTAEYDVLAAFATEQLTRANTWPSLSLSGGLSSGSANLADLLNPADIALSLGSRLAGVLFAGDLNRTRIAASEASADQALRSYGATVMDAFADVEGSLDDIALVDARFQYVQEAAEAARETLRLAEIQYKAGDVDLLDVLTFRQRSFQADRTLITIERTRLEARIALYLALGGGNPPL